MIAVPTTLSAAEFSTSAGVTDVARHKKQRFNHPLIVPRSVVLDPVATLDTPQELFLSSGMRAMDHAVERWLSIAPTPYADAVSLQAMGMLAHALPAIRKHPEDLQARLEAQMAAWLSTLGEAARTSVGASHGLGYILGAVRGVPHGVTSCITLPAVLAWNEPVNAERQKLVSAKLGSPERRAARCHAGVRRSARRAVPPARRRHQEPDLPDLASRYDGTGPISTIRGRCAGRRTWSRSSSWRFDAVASARPCGHAPGRAASVGSRSGARHRHGNAGAASHGRRAAHASHCTGPAAGITLKALISRGHAGLERGAPYRRRSRKGNGP